MHHGAAQSQRQRQRPPVLVLRYCPRPPRRHLAARNTKGTGARPQPHTTPPPRPAPVPCPARPALLLSFAPSPPSSATRQNSDLAEEFWMNLTSIMRRTLGTQILRLARPRAGSRTPIVRTWGVGCAWTPPRPWNGDSECTARCSPGSCGATSACGRSPHAQAH